MFCNEVGVCTLVRFQIFALTMVCCFLIQKIWLCVNGAIRMQWV
jgi:hypothetical protein